MDFSMVSAKSAVVKGGLLTVGHSAISKERSGMLMKWVKFSGLVFLVDTMIHPNLPGSITG
jgi:hypothetical protein